MLKLYRLIMAKKEEKKILLIEDDQQVLDLMAESLSKDGYFVITAKNGADGIANFYEHSPFDLIISDIKMPEYDGHFVLRWFRNKAANIPIIGITGYPPEVKKAKLNGANSVLVKPFVPYALIKEVEDLLRKVPSRIDPLDRYLDMLKEYVAWLEENKKSFGENYMNWPDSEYQKLEKQNYQLAGAEKVLDLSQEDIRKHFKVTQRRLSFKAI